MATSLGRDSTNAQRSFLVGNIVRISFFLPTFFSPAAVSVIAFCVTQVSPLRSAICVHWCGYVSVILFPAANVFERFGFKWKDKCAISAFKKIPLMKTWGPRACKFPFLPQVTGLVSTFSKVIRVRHMHGLPLQWLIAPAYSFPLYTLFSFSVT